MHPAGSNELRGIQMTRTPHGFICRMSFINPEGGYTFWITVEGLEKIKTVVDAMLEGDERFRTHAAN